jgi:hypothetical protein
MQFSSRTVEKFDDLNFLKQPKRLDKRIQRYKHIK